MGDKNQTVRVTSTSTQAKTGHAQLKAAYITVPGDRIFEIIDGTGDGDTTIVNVDATSATFSPILMPYINTPMRDGLRVQVVSGTTGELLVVFE